MTSNNLRVGWRATAGSMDKGEMIALFQTALMKEIDYLKKGKGGNQFDVYDGQRIYSSRASALNLQKERFPMSKGKPMVILFTQMSHPCMLRSRIRVCSDLVLPLLCLET